MRSRSSTLSPLAAGLALVALSCDPGPKGPPDFGTAEQPRLVTNLDASSFEAWRAHVWPTPDELSWEEIPWIPRFRDGLVEADAKQKPLLTWVMNGHPLGCT